MRAAGAARKSRRERFIRGGYHHEGWLVVRLGVRLGSFLGVFVENKGVVGFVLQISLTGATDRLGSHLGERGRAPSVRIIRRRIVNEGVERV